VVSAGRGRTGESARSGEEVWAARDGRGRRMADVEETARVFEADARAAVLMIRCSSCRGMLPCSVVAVCADDNQK